MRCSGLLHLDATRSDEIRVQRSKFPAYLTGQIDYIVGIEYQSNPPPPFPFAAIRSSRTKTCFAVRWGKLNWNRRRRGAAGPPGEWGRLRVLGRFDSLFFQGGLGMRFCFCKGGRFLAFSCCFASPAMARAKFRFCDTANREIHPAEPAGWCRGGVPGCVALDLTLDSNDLPRL